MDPQQTQGVVKSIRRNVSGAAVTAREPSVSSAPSSPTRAHGVTEQAWEEEPSGFAAPSSSSHDQLMTELARFDARFDARFEGFDARFGQVQAGFDARLDQVQAQLQRIEAGRCCVLL